MTFTWKSKNGHEILVFEALSAFYMTGFLSLFVLYFTEDLKYESTQAFALLGTIGAIRYGLPIITGKITDHYISPLLAVFFGAIFQFLGMTIIFIAPSFLMLGLGLTVLGYSFLKPNLTVILDRKHEGKTDTVRNASFSLFYGLGDLGSFIAPLLYGFVGSIYGWKYGFLISSVSLLVLVGLFLSAKGNLQTVRQTNKKSFVKFMGIAMAILLCIFLILQNLYVTKYIMYVSVAFLFLFLGKHIREASNDLRQKYLKLFLIVFLVILFFAFFEQQIFFLPLFIKRYVDAQAFGFTIPTPWFNAISPLVVVIMGATLSKHWLKQDKKGKHVSYTSKLYIAFILLSLSFFTIAYGLSITTDKLSSLYIVMSYILCSLGNIILIPSSIALIMKLSDPSQKSFFIGVFYLTMAFAQPIAGFISSLIIVENTVSQKIPTSYLASFITIGCIALLAAFSVFCARKLIDLYNRRKRHELE